MPLRSADWSRRLLTIAPDPTFHDGRTYGSESLQRGRQADSGEVNGPVRNEPGPVIRFFLLQCQCAAPQKSASHTGNDQMGAFRIRAPLRAVWGDAGCRGRTPSASAFVGGGRYGG